MTILHETASLRVVRRGDWYGTAIYIEDKRGRRVLDYPFFDEERAVQRARRMEAERVNQQELF